MGPVAAPYIQGQELRLRSELGLASDLQVVVMNRTLQEQMEKDVFDQYVEGVQTRIDNQTPPEMRWLVMFPKLPGSDMGPLRDQLRRAVQHEELAAAVAAGRAVPGTGVVAPGSGHTHGADDRPRPPDAAHTAGRSRRRPLADVVAPV
jgi:hypothetical protein